MDNGYYIIIGLLVFGIAYGLFKKPTSAGKTSNSTWAVLIVLGGLIGGLVVAGTMQNEACTWFFGISLMVAMPVFLFFSVGSSVGSFLRPVKENTVATAKKKADGAAVVCFAAALVLCTVFPWFSAVSALLGVFFWVKSKKHAVQSSGVQD